MPPGLPEASSLILTRSYLKTAALGDTSLKATSKYSFTPCKLGFSVVRRPNDGVHAVVRFLLGTSLCLAPYGARLRLFKIAPCDFVGRFCLVSPSLATFEMASRCYKIWSLSTSCQPGKCKHMLVIDI